MRVLVVEDDSATAQSIELMLKSESFNVYTTDLGEEGIDLGKIWAHICCNDPLFHGCLRRRSFSELSISARYSAITALATCTIPPPTAAG